VSRRANVALRTLLLVAANLAGFFLFQHPAREGETWLAAHLAGLFGPNRSVVVGGTSIVVVPFHGPAFQAIVTPACSSISSVCSIICLAFLIRGQSTRRWATALLAAVGAVVAGNVIRIGSSVVVGLFSGRAALVLFHDWLGSTFAFAYTLGGFILLLYLVLPDTRRARPEEPPSLVTAPAASGVSPHR